MRGNLFPGPSIELIIEAHALIHSTLPDIMGEPVKCYSDGGRIESELDFTLYSTTMDGPCNINSPPRQEIINSFGQSVIHQLYKNIRSYFSVTRLREAQLEQTPLLQFHRSRSWRWCRR